MNKYITASFGMMIIISSCAKESSQNSQPVNNNNNNNVFDIDSNMYHVTTIGTQVWMEENLKTTHYRNGDPIPQITEDTAWVNNSTGAYCNFDNDSGNVNKYGHLYNWYAVNNPKGLCPAGWHIPSDSEWTILINYLGGQGMAGAELKATTLWSMPNEGANNKSNLSFYPAGGRFENGNFSGIGEYGAFWSCTEYDSTSVLYRNVNYDNSQVYRAYFHKLAGFSCRCVKDK